MKWKEDLFQFMTKLSVEGRFVDSWGLAHLWNPWSLQPLGWLFVYGTKQREGR
jgi:hypothetical protein